MVPVAAILRSVYRFSFAATQDENPVVAFLHINYAIGNLNILLETMPREEIQRHMKADLDILQQGMIRLQDRVQAELFERCR